MVIELKPVIPSIEQRAKGTIEVGLISMDVHCPALSSEVGRRRGEVKLAADDGAQYWR